MRYTPDEVMQFIEEEDAKFIRLAFCDAYGVQKNVSIMPGELMKAFEEGISIGSGEIAGFSNGDRERLYLIPDPSTLAILPWRPDSGRVVRMFCDVFTPDGKPFEGDTRRILREAVKRADEAGVEFRFGSASEFYLFRKDEAGNPTKIPYDQAGYMDIAPLDRGENIRREICLTIEQMGLTPERSHHERGPGQNEIDFHFGRPLKAADQMTTFKMVVQTVADRNGLIADFSPVPLPDAPGNGYHINIYAVDREGNDLCRYAAAGIIDKIRDMTLFLNPADGSYARFGTGTAPDRVNWSSTDGSEMVHISTHHDKTRVDLRSPDALSNPYLVYALLIHAGLHGIEGKLELPKEMDAGGMLLPQSRREAMQATAESDFIKTLLPEEIRKCYLS